ncbi:MAG: DUF4364 family protein [Eubacteriaceae bacterium]|nr:DUF4364 family protein [Eubacteriaceae bacterium]
MYFDSENVLENKLIILYALNQFKVPINKEQISQIILENVQISYFDVQFLINSLLEDEFLNKIDDNNHEYFSISEKGRDTLNLFTDRIPFYLKEIIDIFIRENKDKVLKQVKNISSFKITGDGEFEVSLRLLENDVSLIDLTLNVVNKTQARFICDNWEAKGQSIYTEIIDALIK